MTRYLVEHLADTALILNSSFQFGFPDGIVVGIRDQMDVDDDGQPLKHWLSVWVLCNASDPLAAFDVARPFAALVTALISVSHTTVIEHPKSVRVIDTSAGVHDREFVEYVYLPIKTRPARMFDRDRFDIFWRYLDNAPSERAQRIHLAIRWYRKALLDDDALDQFLNLWTALEALNPLLKAKYGLPQERSVRQCPSCGEDVITVPTLAGVEYLLLTLRNESRGTWKLVHSLRNEISHGFGNAHTWSERARQALPALRGALLLAILDLIEVPKDQRDVFEREWLRRGDPPYARVRLTLGEVDLNDIRTEKVKPHYRVLPYKPKFDVRDDKTVGEQGQSTLELRGFNGPVKRREVAIFGEQHPDEPESGYSFRFPTV